MGNQRIKRQPAVEPGLSRIDRKFYETYTLQRYNDTVTQVFSHRSRRLLFLLSSLAILGLLAPGGELIQNNLDVILLAFKLTWLIPIPLLILYYLGVFSVKPRDLTIDPHLISTNNATLASSRILYTIVSRGLNVDSVERSVSSVLYWANRVSVDYGVGFDHEVWIVTEKDSYEKLKDRYDKIVKKGVRLIVVPPEYQTKNRTEFKARALQYAGECRLRAGYDTSNDWIYHQDDETAVGEDTIMGNLEFILNSDGELTYGAGIILYPQAWRNNLSSAAEFWRSSLLDVLYLNSMKRANNTTPGQHGSHLLLRADVENRVGWDFGPNTLTEDTVYATRILRENPEAIGIMKGFAFEQPPFTSSDLLKQRRRWVLGDLTTLARRDVRVREKLPMLAGLIVWFSALPVIIGFFIGMLHVSGGRFLGDGFILGLLSYSVYDVYLSGYELNVPYLANRPTGLFTKLKLVKNCLLAAFVDSFAPWNAIIRRTKRYEVIEKDAVEPRS